MQSPPRYLLMSTLIFYALIVLLRVYVFSLMCVNIYLYVCKYITCMSGAPRVEKKMAIDSLDR